MSFFARCMNICSRCAWTLSSIASIWSDPARPVGGWNVVIMSVHLRQALQEPVLAVVGGMFGPARTNQRSQMLQRVSSGCTGSVNAKQKCPLALPRPCPSHVLRRVFRALSPLRPRPNRSGGIARRDAAWHLRCTPQTRQRRPMLVRRQFLGGIHRCRTAGGNDAEKHAHRDRAANCRGHCVKATGVMAASAAPVAKPSAAPANAPAEPTVIDSARNVPSVQLVRPSPWAAPSSR